VKNLTTAEGGAVTWTNTFGMTEEEMYTEYMLLSLHGQSKDALSKMKKGTWEYDIIYPAYKCNMTDILAAVGLVQLSRYDELQKKRYDLIKCYEKYLNSNLYDIVNHYNDDSRSSGHLMLVNIRGAHIETRNNLIEYMSNYGIATNVHYKPLPLFTAYKKLGFNIADFPNAFNKYQNEISLPVHTLMNNDDVIYISKIMNSFFERNLEDVQASN
jgi:dTDP-4-amino-4,6-dideoxygalactose transaminase